MPGAGPQKQPAASEPASRDLDYVRFTAPTMLWGSAYGYAAVGLVQTQGIYGYAAERILRTPDEVLVCRKDGKPMAFPISGGAVACYTYSE